MVGMARLSFRHGGQVGFGHLWRPRIFMACNQLHPEGFLADSRMLSSQKFRVANFSAYLASGNNLRRGSGLAKCHSRHFSPPTNLVVASQSNSHQEKYPTQGWALFLVGMVGFALSSISDKMTKVISHMGKYLKLKQQTCCFHLSVQTLQ